MKDTWVLQEIKNYQDLITRHNRNSFQLKQYAVTLTGFAVLGNQLGNADYLIALIAVPLLVMWFLDAFYLNHERITRKSYDILTAAINEEQMEKGKRLLPYFDMALYYKGSRGKMPSVRQTFFSKTIMPFYLSLILVVSLIWMI